MITSRRLFLAGSTTMALAALAACSDSVPTVSAVTSTPTAQPVLDSDRLTTVLARIQKGLDAADKDRSTDALASYLTGPAARARGEEYAEATALKKDEVVETITTTSQAGTVGRTTTFPRTAVTVTEAASSTDAPYLLVLTQDSARDNFELWSWARLFGSIEVPATAAASVGSEQVTDTSDGLVATPKDVLAAYVDALNDPSGKNGKAFADDPIRQRVASERAADLADQGKVTVKAAAGSDGIKGLSTAEDGAIIMTTLTVTTVYQRTVAGASIKVGDELTAMLGGDGTVKGTVTAVYDIQMAFTIPSKSAGGQPTAIGATFVIGKVSRDDSSSPGEG